MKKALYNLVGCMALIVSGSAYAGIMSAVDPVSPSASAACRLNFTCGWSFTVDVMIDVVALGQWDEGVDGLSGSADVGLWLTDGTLLASTTVPTGTAGTLVGNHRYTSISPLKLMTGLEYVIGSAFTGGDADVLLASEFNALINPVSGKTAGGGTDPSLMFPDFNTSSLYSGPSFLFERSVPAPATIGLFVIGLAGLGWSSRRYRYLLGR